MRPHHFVFFLLFLIVSIHEIEARIIHVPGDRPTIQLGIYVAADGDTVMIDPGIYYEHDIVFLGKAITVMSTDPDDSSVVASTIVDAASAGNVFVFESSEFETSVLTGLKIRGGHALWGGGIKISSASPTLTKNILIANSSGNYPGGAIYCLNSLAIVSDNTITSNDGSGIHCEESAPILTDNVIVNNRRCGIVIQGKSSPTVTNNVIDGNVGIAGAGIRCDNSAPLIFNNLITGNWAALDGGGLYINGSTPILLNNSIVDNSAARMGGGIFSTIYSEIMIVNTILWDNAASAGPEMFISSAAYPSTVTISYSDVEGGEEMVHVSEGSALNWGNGMIDADPDFVSYIGLDYLLNPGSACIDAGHPALDDEFDWPDWYPNDLRSDIGAYGGPYNGGWFD